MCSAVENCFEGDEYLGSFEECGSGSGRYKYDCQFCKNQKTKRKKKKKQQKLKEEI